MKKVALVGTSISAKDAPFNDPSWEIWGVGCSSFPRWDRWFQLHNEETLRSPLNKVHWNWLCAQTNGVIYLPKRYAEIPQGVAFDHAPLLAEFGSWFFTSSVSYMLATALREGVETIGLWGVDLSDSTEYVAQKPGARFFVQVARMRGVKVTMPYGCEIEYPEPLYGLHEPGLMADRVRRRTEELQGRVNGETADLNNLIAKRHMLVGALQIKAAPEELEAKIATLDQEIDGKRIMIASLSGAIQDQEFVKNNWRS